MRFLADVNIPQSVINSLIENGHDILDIKKKQLDLKDSELIKIGKQENRIILTRDKDFLILTQFPKYQIPTIVIRLKTQIPGYIRGHLLQLLKNQNENILNKSLTIIRDDSAKSHPY
jgi:predicted nuclease of predicted toxin-antitoxin system